MEGSVGQVFPCSSICFCSFLFLSLQNIDTTLLKTQLRLEIKNQDLILSTSSLFTLSSLLRNCLHQVFLNRWEHSARSHIEVKYRRSWCRGLLRVTYSSSLQASRLFFRFAFSFGFAAHSLSGFVSVFQKWQADVSMLFHSYKCWTELHLPLHDMKVSS